jgi:hypothetical protein
MSNEENLGHYQSPTSVSYTNPTNIRIGGSTASTVLFTGHIQGWGWSNRQATVAEGQAVVKWLASLKADTLKVG